MHRRVGILAAALIGAAVGFAAQSIASPPGSPLAAPSGQGGLLIAPAPAAPARGAGLLVAGSGVVWAGADRGVYRSSDGGLRFEETLPASQHAATCQCFGDTYFRGADDAWALEGGQVVFASSRIDDPITGYAPTDQVWRTTDGGASWDAGDRLPPLPGLDGAATSTSLSFASGRVGYLVVSGERHLDKGHSLSAVSLAALLRSDDGGRTWQRVASELPATGRRVTESRLLACPPGWLQIAFATAGVGFAAAPGCSGSPRVWETADGGASWRVVPLAVPSGGWPAGAEADVPAITPGGAVVDEVTGSSGQVVVEELGPGGAFAERGALDTGEADRAAPLDVIDATHLALSASDGTWESADGGRRWSFVVSGLDLSGEGPLVLGSGRHAAGFVLISNAGDLAHSSPVVLRTGDGAMRWQPEAETAAGGNTPGYSEITFASALTGYLAGNAGVLATSDGGRRWSHSLPGDAAVSELQAIGAHGAVALGAEVLLSTNDGGRSWQITGEPRQGGLHAVELAGARDGYGEVCGGPLGESAVLVRTVDGGRSWQAASLPVPALCASPLAGPSGASTSGSPTVCVASPSVLYAFGIPGGPPAGEDAARSHDLAQVLFSSRDGGRSWQRIASLGRSPGEIDSCDGEVLWLSKWSDDGSWAELRSDNGGRSFAALLGSARGTKDLAAIGVSATPFTHTSATLAALATPSPGIATAIESCTSCGDHVFIQSSGDGGRRFSAPGTPVPGVIGVQGVASFVTRRIGFVLAPQTLSPTRSSLYETDDAGRSWQLVAVVPSGN